jgi:hypothetical protein
MEDDILNSFFCEVKEVEQTAVNKEEEVDESAPSSKRRKTETTIVATASSSTTSTNEKTSLANSVTVIAAPSTSSSKSSYSALPKISTTTTSAMDGTGALDAGSLQAFIMKQANITSAVSGGASVSGLAVPNIKGLTGLKRDPEKELVMEKQTDRTFVRVAGGEKWVDDTLKEWPKDDFRLFVGDLSPDTQEKDLEQLFGEYKSFAMCRIARIGFSGKSKGFGFVSFLDPFDAAKAMREKNGKYIGPRPIKLSKADWKKRDAKEVKKKERKQKDLMKSLGM